MSVRSAIKGMLARHPHLDGLFRRFVWSHVHFPEAEMRFLASLPRGSIDIAIDVGAALGSYSWIMARKSARVFAFEPGTEHGNYLANLVSGSNITLVRAAVGARSGEMRIFTPGSDENARHSATLSMNNPVVRLPGTNSERVRLVSLDDYFAAGVEGSFDLIKVDIEGYELEAFNGAIGLIQRHRPLIICEIEKRHNADCRLVFELLRRVGYDCLIYRGGGFLPFDEMDIDSVQTAEALLHRIGPDYRPADNAYINNFVFQHPLSKIKVVP